MIDYLSLGRSMEMVAILDFRGVFFCNQFTLKCIYVVQDRLSLLLI